MFTRVVSLLLLVSFAAGQNDESKTITDFEKPFSVVGNLIVDKNFFLLRELTPEEEETGQVNLEDPFNENGSVSVGTTTATTTTTTTTQRSRRRGGSSGFPGLLPPPPGAPAFELPAFRGSARGSSFALPASTPIAPARGGAQTQGRFPPRKAATTSTPETAAVVAETTSAVRPQRTRAGVRRRKVVRVPVSGAAGSRQLTTTTTTTEAPATEAPTTTAPTVAPTEPATTSRPLASSRTPARRTGNNRRRPVVSRRVVGVAPLPVVAPGPALVARAPQQEIRTNALDSGRPAAAATVRRTSSGRVRPQSPENTAENEINAFIRRLPGGSKSVLQMTTPSTFSCKDRPYGYYADMEADCKVFHICTPVEHADGFKQTLKHSLFCNNGTRFDQTTLTCLEESVALPCERSIDYYASVKYFEKFNIFDQLRAREARRQRQLLSRLETLEDVEALEAEYQ